MKILEVEGNTGTRKAAFQLHAAATSPKFIVALALISKYSALLEPTVNALQSSTLNTMKCSEHIQNVIGVILQNRNTVDDIAKEILLEANELCERFCIELKPPRTCSRQTQRANPPATTALEYYKIAFIIPYLDSLQASLRSRFNAENSIAVSLEFLHPHHMLALPYEEFRQKIKQVQAFYSIQGLEVESELWYTTWKNKKRPADELKKLL